jgi:UDP-GlcNAc:undecaprenyl-phosphate/decaprenyl-phosphate GlcNAc-1-phosphate transferase
MRVQHVAMGLLMAFGFVVTYATIPFFRKLAFRHNVVAAPGGRRNHDQPTALLGGAAIFLPFCPVFLVFFALVSFGEIQVNEPERMQMLSLFLGTAWILFLGTVDDKKGLGWGTKLAGQFLGAGILALGGHSIARATVPFFGPVVFGWAGVPLLMIAVVAITNAINLIDGMDGLAGGICFFAALTSSVIGIVKGDIFTATMGFTIAGSLLGFLMYNFPPASIFMGDGGAMMMGFLLGTLATSSSAISPGQRLGTSVMIAIPFLPFGIPLFEVVLSIFRRFVRGQAIFLGDGDHLHNRLRSKIENPRLTIAVFYVISAALCALTLFTVLGMDSDVMKFMGAAIILVILVGIVGSLRMYRLNELFVTLQNRPHFKFLGGFLKYMKHRMRRAESLHELLGLLETGVRDLHFDRVEVLFQGRPLFRWTSERIVHPANPRIHSEESLAGNRITVKWVRPFHDDATYNEYLMLTWHRFLVELRDEIAGHTNNFGVIKKNNVLKMAGKHSSRT